MGKSNGTYKMTDFDEKIDEQYNVPSFISTAQKPRRLVVELSRSDTDDQRRIKWLERRKANGLPITAQMKEAIDIAMAVDTTNVLYFENHHKSIVAAFTIAQDVDLIQTVERLEARIAHLEATQTLAAQNALKVDLQVEGRLHNLETATGAIISKLMGKATTVLQFVGQLNIRKSQRLKDGE